ncbi:MAG: hypothetical protein LC650_03975 [Actinobacteria bacterium]|nr:hypothetical protein [Actinomycetota bacterium]
MMFASSVESVDMGDTLIRILTPDGDYQPYTITWDDSGKDTLVIEVLAVED